MKLLHTASENGNIEIVIELLNCNLDIDDKDEDEDGKTALHMAAENGHAEIVAELLAHGANVNLYNGCNNPRKCGKFCRTENALHMATRRGHTKVVKEILKSKAVRVDARNYLGDTPLQHATMHNNAEIVQGGTRTNIELQVHSPHMKGKFLTCEGQKTLGHLTMTW